MSCTGREGGGGKAGAGNFRRPGGSVCPAPRCLRADDGQGSESAFCQWQPQAYYNDKKPILSNDEFNALREDLAFSGSDVATMNRMEVMFMVAANRYAEGKPVMSDEEFDNIRRKLKARNSLAVVHKVPTCRIDTNVRGLSPIRQQAPARHGTRALATLFCSG
jgi:hypothetical protein